MPISLDEFNKRYSAVAQDRVRPLRGEFGWGDRLGAAVDRFQGQLYGLGEALGFDMAEERRANEAAAAYARLRAIQDTGAPETLGETFSSPGKFIKGVGGLFVDSAPELATSLAAWPLGAAGLGTAGRAALGAALNYPSAVGDILQNQRDEAGTTRLGTAAALGVPYAAVDALGLEGALATGRVMRTGIRALDDMTGVKGALARTAANAGLNSVVEGSTETFQDGMNQLGRMSVNPDQTFINEDSLGRFGESFGAGALMGGVASAALGGWRRSEGYLPPGQDVDQGSTDLLTGETKPLPPPSTVPDEKGGQGQLFGDMGTDGTVSWLRDPQDRTPETLARYAETERLLRQIRAGMADAEATGNAARFYALQEQHDALVGELQQMDRIVSAYQAQTAQPGQMGLFSDGLQPRTNLVVRPDYAPRAPDPIDVNPTPTGNPQFALPTLALPAPQRPNPNALIATQDGIVGRERQFSGQQFNLFDGPTTFGEGATPVEDTPVGYPDTRTRDMLAETPTAMVPTMFNPLEPSRTTGSRGGVAGNIRSQIAQQLQGAGDMTLATQLSLDLAAKVGDLQGMRAVIDQREQAIQKSLNSLDKKVTGDSNLLTPEEYAARREVLDNKLLTVNAARTLVDQYQRALTNAYAEEGLARAQGGTAVGQAPVSTVAEDTMRDASTAQAVAEEQAEIDRITRRRDDVRVATAVPPGLAKATGRLTPRASLDEQGNAAAGPVEAPAPAPAPAPASAPDPAASPAPTRRRARPQPKPSEQPRQETAAVASTPENDTGYLTEVRNLIQAVEEAKGDLEYDGALDALYRRYMDTRSDAEADAIEAYVNESGKAFQRDWARAGNRYEETENAREKGAKGLKLGRSHEGTKSSLGYEAVKSLDGALLSWGLTPTTKFRQATKSLGGRPTLAAIQQAVKSVQNAASYALPITIVNKPSDLGIAPPAGSNPPGVFDGRRIYLFSDNITSMADVYFTIFHELFHLGLSKTVPQAEYHKLMRQFESDPALAPLVSAWKASPDGKSRVGTMSPRDFNALAVEESLAQIAETLTVDGGFGTKRGPIVRALLKWFSNLASTMGMDKFVQALRRMTLTDAEAFVSQTMQAIMGAAGNPSLPVQSGGTKLRQANTLDGRPPTDLSRMPASSRTAVKWLNRALKNSMQYLGTRGAFLLDLLEEAEKYLPSVSRYRALIQRASTDKVRLERATREIVSRFQKLPASRQGTGQGSVNWLLKQSTMRKKWAFVPDWLPDVKASDLDPELRDAFNALPKAEQTIVRDVFRHGYDSLGALKAAIDAAVNEQYKAELAAAAQDPERYSAVLQKIESDKAKFSRLNNLNPNWPYAPLKRFGRFAVIGRSQAFMDLAEAVRNGLGDASALEAMRADPKHYYVEFVDTRLEAQSRVDDLQAQGYIADEAERLEGDEGLLGGRDVFAAFQRLRSAAQELGEDAGVGSQMTQVLRDLYLVLLSESSARQAEAGRAGNRGVAGASDDMMKAFATQGMAMANFVSSVRNSGEIIDTLRDMRAEAKSGTVGTRGDRQMFYNEIARRYAMGLDYAPMPLLDAALSFNSFWTLLTNPSYFLVNSLQPWTASAPYIGGRFGMGRTYEAFFRAYKDIAPLAVELVKRGSDVLPRLPESGMLEELMNRGRIDITLQADLGSFRSGGTMAGRLAEKALTAPRVAAERVELVNRIVTATAAYRLAKQSGMSEQAAIDYADKAVYQTHGDYSGFNAPRFMRHPVGRVMTQFRKFQLIQLTLFFKMARDTIGEIKDRDARYGAYRSLLFSLGHMLAFGGVMALPGIATLAWWAGVFDDDEPDDPEATLRRLFGEDLATLLTKGVPAALGVDISRRVGAGDMLVLLPYADVEPEREGYLEILAALAGPLIGGTGLRAYEAIGHFAEGDFVKGLQKSLPSGFANAVRAIEYSTKGYTARNGDVLLSPDELGFMAVMGQALGLPTTTITNAQSLRSTVFKADKFFSQKTTEIKGDYVEAVRSGDWEAANEALAAWTELQETRQALGYKRQPMSEILKAPRERAKRESGVIGGAPTTRANREFVRRQAELM